MCAQTQSGSSTPTHTDACHVLWCFALLHPVLHTHTDGCLVLSAGERQSVQEHGDPPGARARQRAWHLGLRLLHRGGHYPRCVLPCNRPSPTRDARVHRQRHACTRTQNYEPNTTGRVRLRSQTFRWPHTHRKKDLRGLSSRRSSSAEALLVQRYRGLRGSSPVVTIARRERSS